MPKYAIKVTPETLPFCEFIQGRSIPHIPGEFYFLVNTDMEPGQYTMASVPANSITKSLPITILTPAIVP